jgi:UDP-3-O-[3-hydroxymyristoyl] glucosamine N-acyltransferase
VGDAVAVGGGVAEGEDVYVPEAVPVTVCGGVALGEGVAVGGAVGVWEGVPVAEAPSVTVTGAPRAALSRVATPPVTPAAAAPAPAPVTKKVTA